VEAVYGGAGGGLHRGPLSRARREDVDDAMAFVEEALSVFKCLES